MWIVRMALRQPYTFVVFSILILLVGVLAILSLSELRFRGPRTGYSSGGWLPWALVFGTVYQDPDTGGRDPEGRPIPSSDRSNCSCQFSGLRSRVTPSGSTVIGLSLPGHMAPEYSVKRGEFDAGAWHPGTRSRREGVSLLRLSTIPLIRSSMKWAHSRRITTFRTATEKHATRNIEITAEERRR
jgi:hypothetical protein